MKKLILLRHGESIWNMDNRFTGWIDIPLSERGVAQAIKAGQTIKDAGIELDMTYTSVLSRAIHTWWHVLVSIDRVWLPVERTWRMNERHYGSLQGLNKAETIDKFGSEQVNIWRRSYDVPPPALDFNDPKHPRFDPRFKNIPAEELPASECLKDTLTRVLPFWNTTLLPKFSTANTILVVAHGNSIRALIKHLDGISDADIVSLNIPTGIPLVYELDDTGKPLKHYYLGDPAEVEAAIAEVSNIKR